ncbi:hypothetical protein [Microlunatus parietis]|uniref:Uncharacterized protein n=1 Tax=Microlunatus parietis TaxID=682979 RepID=A0A7Y9ICV7_9ACTN|nr:hypothetical protein [Microlunatus parietis]NYE74395.1 hypothetical protein [Microlunatus parietis]
MPPHSTITFDRATVGGVAVAGALLAGTIGIAVWCFLDQDVIPMVGWLIAAGVLIVIMVRTVVADPARPAFVRGVTAVTVLGVLAGIVAAVAVPLRLRQVEYGGTGVIWQADPAVTGDGLRPVGVIGEAAVLKNTERAVFLALADGRFLGEVALRGGDRLTIAGDHVLVSDDERSQLYDATGRPLWPTEVAGAMPLAASGDVTVLHQTCNEVSSCAVGYDLTGSKVWQAENPQRLLDHRSRRLPEHVLVRKHAHWQVLDPAGGRVIETVDAELALATDTAIVAIDVDENGGLCDIRIGRQQIDRSTACDFQAVRDLGDGVLAVDSAEPGIGIAPTEPPEEPTQFDSATVDGDPGDTAVGRYGWAQLSGRTLEFNDWGPSLAHRTVRELPIELNDGAPAGVLVEAGAAIVEGTAEPRLGEVRPNRQVIIFDFASGAETGRIRLPHGGSWLSRDDVLTTGPGQVLISTNGQPPMLIGRRT